MIFEVKLCIAILVLHLYILQKEQGSPFHLFACSGVIRGKRDLIDKRLDKLLWLNIVNGAEAHKIL